MYRYRDEGGTTYRSRSRFKHVEKLGRIHYVKAYRFRSRRRPKDSPAYSTSRECVLVRGENGTARFTGLCWSYGGEGPRGLVELLVKLGLPKERAEHIAFQSQRHQTPGTDWTLYFESGNRPEFVARQE